MLSGGSYVIRPSTNQPVIGSKFTLTLAPVCKVSENPEDTAKDENANEKLRSTGKRALNGGKHAENPERPAENAAKQDKNSEFDDKFLSMFRNVAGADNEVDAFELQSVMGMIFKRDFGSVKNFNLESCRSMVVMADADRSGRLTFQQFKKLFQWIMELRKIYKNYETTPSWDMDAEDLKEALKSLGFKISSESIGVIAVRYYNRDKRINFDDFLQICSRLRASSDSYDSYVTVTAGRESFDDYLMHVVYT